MVHKVDIIQLDKDGKICFYLKLMSNIRKSCDKDKELHEESKSKIKNQEHQSFPEIQSSVQDSVQAEWLT